MLNHEIEKYRKETRFRQSPATWSNTFNCKGCKQFKGMMGSRTINGKKLCKDCLASLSNK